MRKKACNIRLVIIVSLLFFSLALSGIAKTLNVPAKIQEQSNWCWAACTQATIYYYCCDYQQCNIADSARKWNNWGAGNCCQTPGNNICNQANFMYGTAGSFQALMDSLCNVQSNGMNSTLSKNTTVSEINAGRPYEIRWGWSGGGGHFLVGRGYEANGDTVHYMDPRSGYGYQTATYDWVVSGSDHDWTHSLQLTSNPPSLCARLVPGSQTICRGKNMYFTFMVDNNTENNVGGTLTFTGYMDYGCQPYNIMIQIPRHKSYPPGGTEEHYFFNVPGAVQPGYYSASISGNLSGNTVFCCIEVDVKQCYPWRTSENTEWSLRQVESPEVLIPTVTCLHQNYPNPFNDETNITYTLAEPGNVTLKVYDICGRLVLTLLEGYEDAGPHLVTWEATNVSSGVYFYKLTCGDYSATKKMNLLK
jgi:hypothetical protein